MIIKLYKSVTVHLRDDGDYETSNYVFKVLGLALFSFVTDLKIIDDTEEIKEIGFSK